MIRFTCVCGKQLQSRDDSAGQSVICPACGQRQIVPAAGEDAIRPLDEKVRKDRPSLRTEPDDEPEPVAAGTSGKAVASLVLGIMSVFCSVLTGLPALIVGILALREIGRSRGRLGGNGLATAGVITACAGTLMSCVVGGVLVLPALLLPAVQKVREAATRVQSQTNLKQLALAMHSYHEQNFRYPTAAINDKKLKPLLSWRVALLPYLGEKALYDQFKLDEPWDSPNNIKLLSRMPLVYQCAAAQAPPDQTVYQVFVGEGAAFEMQFARRLADMQDGMANIIMIVEARQPVPWTKPEDLPFDANKPLPPLGVASENGFNAVAMDGAVHFIPKNTPERTLRLLIQRADGQVANFP